MFIADSKLFYRYLWCFKCSSVRFHSLRRKSLRKIGNVWWVEYETHCYGLATYPTYKRKREDRDCDWVERRWVPASQWNALAKQDAFAA